MPVNQEPETQQLPNKLELNQQQSQCMALAALVQSAEQVRQLAFNGSANEYQVRPLLHSLFQFTPQHSIDVYGDLRLLEQGFNRLYHLMQGQLNPIDKDILRYSIALISLADQLIDHDDFLDIIEQRLKQLAYPNDQAWLDLAHPIAAIYTDTISKLGRRIQVSGDANHLKNELNAARIRTLLFSGVRAALLWRQLNGSKLTLFFQRGKYQRTIKQLIPINTPAE